MFLVKSARTPLPPDALSASMSTPRTQARVSTPPGDARAVLPALVDRVGPRLYALALRLCGNHADAEDMVQEVFLQAHRKWHTFRGEADPATWLYAIAARSCKARTRRKGGADRRTPALSQLMPWQESSVAQFAAAGADSSHQSERNEAIHRVQEEIARLPEHFRLPLVLKEVLELSVEDTAGALALEVNTVKTRLHRARLALRKAMTAKAPAVPAPAPIYERQVCFDLLKAKMEAMDRGGVAKGFAVPQAELCARCRAVFRELDLVQDACAQLGDGQMPAAFRKALLSAIAASSPATPRPATPTTPSPRSTTSARRATGAGRTRARGN